MEIDPRRLIAQLAVAVIAADGRIAADEVTALACLDDSGARTAVGTGGGGTAECRAPAHRRARRLRSAARAAPCCGARDPRRTRYRSRRPIGISRSASSTCSVTRLRSWASPPRRLSRSSRRCFAPCRVRSGVRPRHLSRPGSPRSPSPYHLACSSPGSPMRSTCWASPRPPTAPTSTRATGASSSATIPRG